MGAHNVEMGDHAGGEKEGFRNIGLVGLSMLAVSTSKFHGTLAEKHYLRVCSPSPYIRIYKILRNASPTQSAIHYFSFVMLSGSKLKTSC